MSIGRQKCIAMDENMVINEALINNINLTLYNESAIFMNVLEIFHEFVLLNFL